MRVIRDARDEDIPGITAIYNEIIASSTAVFREQPYNVEERYGWWRTRCLDGFPTLVAADEAGVLGFATFGAFRSSPGYRFTVEHTVHVASAARGTGAGTDLMHSLIPRARSLGKHVMLGGIDAANQASLRFHARLGFEQIAHLSEVGFKFERFLDLIFVRLWLTPPVRSSPRLT
jgi:phosphinothricin acetyltransferase